MTKHFYLLGEQAEQNNVTSWCTTNRKQAAWLNDDVQDKTQKVGALLGRLLSHFYDALMFD